MRPVIAFTKMVPSSSPNLPSISSRFTFRSLANSVRSKYSQSKKPLVFSILRAPCLVRLYLGSLHQTSTFPQIHRRSPQSPVPTAYSAASRLDFVGSSTLGKCGSLERHVWIEPILMSRFTKGPSMAPWHSKRSGEPCKGEPQDATSESRSRPPNFSPHN